MHGHAWNCLKATQTLEEPMYVMNEIHDPCTRWYCQPQTLPMQILLGYIVSRQPAAFWHITPGVLVDSDTISCSALCVCADYQHRCQQLLCAVVPDMLISNSGCC